MNPAPKQDNRHSKPVKTAMTVPPTMMITPLRRTAVPQPGPRLSCSLLSQLVTSSATPDVQRAGAKDDEGASYKLSTAA